MRITVWRRVLVLLFGGLELEMCSLNAAFVSATVRKCLQPFAPDRRDGTMAVPLASSAKAVTFGGFSYPKKFPLQNEDP